MALSIVVALNIQQGLGDPQCDNQRFFFDHEPGSHELHRRNASSTEFMEDLQKGAKVWWTRYHERPWIHLAAVRWTYQAAAADTSYPSFGIRE